MHNTRKLYLSFTYDGSRITDNYENWSKYISLEALIEGLKSGRFKILSIAD